MVLLLKRIFFLLFLLFLNLASAEELPPIESRLKEFIRYDQKENKIGLITIADHTNAIDQSTWIYVKSALDYYKTIKPKFIILRLDTPGGEVFAAQKISDALKEMDTQYHIPIVALIDNWAISAGAMLAYSSRFIAVVKDASMGAAEPITLGEGGEMKTASEKVNSALRADFGNRARFFDRNPAIAEAMVDKDLILVQREGKIIKLDLESQLKLTGDNPDIIISPKGKLLTLTSKEMIEYGVADIYLPPVSLEPITDQEWELGHWPSSKNILFEYPYFKNIPNATIDVYKMDWRTTLLAFLAKPAIASLLFMGLLLGAYMEFNSGGFGFGGSLALVCLLLLMLSSFALEAVNVLEMVLMGMGMVIILVDFLLLPTFGLLGSIGMIFFLVGLFGLIIPGLGSVSFDWDSNTLNAAGESVLIRLAWYSGALILSVLIMFFLTRYMTPRAGLFKRFISIGEEDASEGYVAGLEASKMPKVGEVGEALSTLRPAGKVIIQDQLYDAVSNGTFIERGDKIVVTDIDGYRIVVSKREGS